MSRTPADFPMKLNVFPLVILLLSAPSPASADDQGFPRWLVELKRDALAQGIPAAAVDAALTGVALQPRVLELDQRQPESALNLTQYLANALVPARIARGRTLKADNRALLRKVADRYGAPPKTIMALWAIESGYGAAMGKFRVIDALATLAYDGRRPDLFRAELIDALRIVARGKFTADELRGSWAGAMGQPQFMPSTYLKYAVDYSHRGEADIWYDKADVFASAANYLSELGWKRDESWGREVRLPRNFDSAQIGLPTKRSVADWARLGVLRADGGALPASRIEGSIVAPDGAQGRSFLVYDNFRTIMKWNHSTNFALAVCLLGDAIGN
jgi:membrane-bound lytic murein transglycosylase B